MSDYKFAKSMFRQHKRKKIPYKSQGGVTSPATRKGKSRYIVTARTRVNAADYGYPLASTGIEKKKL